MQDPALQYGQALKSVTSLLSHLKSLAEQELWLLEVLKRRCGIAHGHAAELRKAVNKGVGIGSVGMDGGVTQNLKALLKDLGDESTDQLSFETYLRNNHLSVLEKNQKNREHKLKKRSKSLLDHLARLESAEKVYARTASDLGYEKKKYNDLEQGRRLDRAEEIEKVEIDLRRVGSNLNVKQAEYDIARSKMDDIHRVWANEWEGFRIYARQVELDRMVEIRNCLTDLSRADLLVREAEIHRGQAFLARLEQIDITSDLDHLSAFQGLPHLSSSIPSAGLINSFAAQIWPSSSSRPGGAMTAAQAASWSLPLASSARTRPGALPLPERTSSKSSNGSVSPIHSPAAMSFGSYGKEVGSVAGTPTKPSSKEYGEEMFSVRRKAVPAEHGISLDEFGNLKSASADSLSSTSSSLLGHPGLSAFPTSRKASKPLPGLPSYGQPPLARRDGSTSPSTDSHDAQEDDTETSSAEEEDDDTLGDLPASQVDTEVAGNRKKEMRKSAPPTLPSFTNLKLTDMDWSLEGQVATVA